VVGAPFAAEPQVGDRPKGHEQQPYGPEHLRAAGDFGALTPNQVDRGQYHEQAA